MIAYIFLCFGYVSRRCERQADLFGGHVAGFPAMIRALEKVADINGIPRQLPGWFAASQHGTMAERSTSWSRSPCSRNWRPGSSGVSMVEVGVDGVAGADPSTPATYRKNALGKHHMPKLEGDIPAADIDLLARFTLAKARGLPFP